MRARFYLVFFAFLLLAAGLAGCNSESGGKEEKTPAAAASPVQTEPTPEQAPKPEEQTPRPEEQAAKPEEQASRPEEQASRPEEQASKPEEQTPKPEEQAADLKLTPEEREQWETARWNAYVDLSNALDEPFFTALGNYAAVFGTGEKLVRPADEDIEAAWRNSVEQAARTIGMLDAANALAANGPHGDLDRAAQDFAQAVTPLWIDISVLKDYLENKEYMDDNGGRGNALHGRILARLQNFDAAYTAFHEAMNVKAAGLRTSEVARMKEAGMQLLPSMLETLLQAERIQVFLQNKEVTDKNLLQTVTEDDMLPLFTAFSDSLNTLEAENTEETASREGISFQYSSMFLSDAKEYKTHLTAMREVLQSNKLPDVFSKGGQRDMVRLYGRLVDLYNASLQ